MMERRSAHCTIKLLTYQYYNSIQFIKIVTNPLSIKLLNESFSNIKFVTFKQFQYYITITRVQ